MKRQDWTVTEYAVRPARPDGTCFYCRAPVGDQHASDCVIRRRTVVVRAEISYVIDVPETWTAADIEFHRNDGSWCASNLIDELDAVGGDETDRCLCELVEFTYAGEATKGEECRCGVRVAELES